MYNAVGICVSSEKEVEQVAVQYFEELFTSTTPSNFEEALGDFSPSIMVQNNEMLTALATEEEVRSALFMMNPEKALGQDGMTALFSNDLGK